MSALCQKRTSQIFRKFGMFLWIEAAALGIGIYFTRRNVFIYFRFYDKCLVD